jgi:hypothetical protein
MQSLKKYGTLPIDQKYQCLTKNCQSPYHRHNAPVNFSIGTFNITKVVEPLNKQFWGDTFGVVEDKFGISWMLNHTPD